MDLKCLFTFSVTFFLSFAYSQCNKTYPLVENGGIKIYNSKGELIKGPFLMAAPYESSSYDLVMSDFPESNYNKLHFPAMVSQNGKWGLINEEGNFITSLVQDTLQTYYEIDSISYILITRKNGKLGAINSKGEQVCPPIFDGINRDGNLIITTFGEKRGAYSFQGKKLFDTLYTTIQQFTFDDNDRFLIGSNGKYGIYSIERDKFILPIVYQDISLFDYPTKTTNFRIRTNDKMGIMDKNLYYILPAEYDYITSIGNSVVFIRMGNYAGLFDLQKKEIIAWLECSKIMTYKYGENGYYLFEHKDKIGLIDSTGKILMEPKYQGFSDGIFIDTTGLRGIFDPNTGVFEKDGYDYLDHVYLGDYKYCYVGRKGNKYTILNDKGNIVHQENNVFGCTMVYYSSDSPYGLTDYTSEHIFELLKIGKKKILFDYDLQEVYKFEYDQLYGIDSVWIDYELNGNKGRFNRKNSKLSIAPTNNLVKIRNGVLFEKKGKWGLMSETGKVIIPATYDSIVSSETSWFYNQELLFASKEGKWGVIKQNEEIVISFQFEWLNTIGPEFFIGTLMGEKVFTDNKGNILQPGKLDHSVTLDSLSYLDSTFTIVKDGLYGRCRFDGTIYIEPQFSILGEFYTGNLAVAVKDGKYGAIHSSGKVVVPFIYDYLSEFYDEVAVFQAGDQEGKIDTLGRIVNSKKKGLVSAYMDCDGLIIADETIIGYTDSTGKIIARVHTNSFETENAGEVSELVCMLEDLQYYYNQGNDWDYNFTLPDCFYNLKKLKQLKILNSDLSGFSNLISNLKSLEQIEVSSNTFSSLPPEIGQLKNLKRLSITTNILLDVPKEIGNLSQLKFLKLYSSWSSTLPNEILNLKNVDSLCLGSMNIPTDFTPMKNLKYLELEGCNVPDDGNAVILKLINPFFDNSLIDGWKQLKTLNISYGGFEMDNNPWILFFPRISGLSNLEVIDFSDNYYDSFAYYSFDDFIKSNVSYILSFHSLKTIIVPNGYPVSEETAAQLPEIKFDSRE